MKDVCDLTLLNSYFLSHALTSRDLGGRRELSFLSKDKATAGLTNRTFRAVVESHRSEFR